MTPEEGLLGLLLKTQYFNVNASPFCWCNSIPPIRLHWALRCHEIKKKLQMKNSFLFLAYSSQILGAGQVCQAVLTVQVKVLLIIFLCKFYCRVVLRLLTLSIYLKYPPKLCILINNYSLVVF